MSQVTHIRASYDYQREVYDPSQWAIGHTSILLDSLGIFPFKDCFWSNGTSQPGCAQPVCQEANPVLQTLVSLLSAGPVAPSDKIGYLSLENIMQTTRADGLLLKPDVPARTMDWTFSQGFLSRPTLLNLTSTYSNHILQTAKTNTSVNWYYIFAADTLQQIQLDPSTLGETDGNYYVFDYFQTPTGLSKFSSLNPLVIPALHPTGNTVSFKYYVVFQAMGNYTLIGERHKFAGASKQRFNSITQTTENETTMTTISFSGAESEKVMIEMLHTPSMQIEAYTCTAGSTSKLVCSETTTAHSCKCM